MLPIYILKDNIKLSILDRLKIKPPFVIKAIGGFSVVVSSDDELIYFVRKRSKFVKGAFKDTKIIKFCIGVKTKYGVIQKYWIDTSGNYISVNLENR